MKKNRKTQQVQEDQMVWPTSKTFEAKESLLSHLQITPLSAQSTLKQKRENEVYDLTPVQDFCGGGATEAEDFALLQQHLRSVSESSTERDRFSIGFPVGVVDRKKKKTIVRTSPMVLRQEVKKSKEAIRYTQAAAHPIQPWQPVRPLQKQPHASGPNSSGLRYLKEGVYATTVGQLPMAHDDQQSGGLPPLALQLIGDVGHEAQLSASQYVMQPGAQFAKTSRVIKKSKKQAKKDRSLREEEVNETYEEYESMPHHYKGDAASRKQELGMVMQQQPAATGLHERMAQLATQPALCKSSTQNVQQWATTTRGKAPPKLKLEFAGLQAQAPVFTSRSATRSPAMGGRKTIMNLSSRLDQVAAAPIPTGKDLVNVASVIEPSSRNHLPSISEKNESSKPTSKIESSNNQHILSSMITMRSMLGPNTNVPMSSNTPQYQITHGAQSPSSMVTSPALPAKNQHLLQLEIENQQSSPGSKKKQFPSRVRITLEANNRSQQLQPILTTTIEETLQSQGQLTVQQKNFTFNETPSSAQQPMKHNFISPQEHHHYQHNHQHQQRNPQNEPTGAHQKSAYHLASNGVQLDEPLWEDVRPLFDSTRQTCFELTRSQPLINPNRSALASSTNMSSPGARKPTAAVKRKLVKPSKATIKGITSGVLASRQPSQGYNQIRNAGGQAAAFGSCVGSSSHERIAFRKVDNGPSLANTITQCRTPVIDSSTSPDYFSLSNPSVTIQTLPKKPKMNATGALLKKDASKPKQKVNKSGKALRKNAKMAPLMSTRPETTTKKHTVLENTAASGEGTGIPPCMLHHHHQHPQQHQLKSATQPPQHQMETPLFGNRTTAIGGNQHHPPQFSPQSSFHPQAQHNQPVIEQDKSSQQQTPYHNYMILHQQSKLINQIRQDIQTRKQQQDERAEIISRILVDQDKSLVDESSVSLVSRQQHRRSQSMDRSQLYKGTTSSFVSSFSCSFVEYKGDPSMAMPPSKDPIMTTMPLSTTVTKPKQVSMIHRPRTTIKQQQQQCQTTTNEDLSNQLTHYLEQHQNHAKQFSYGAYPGTVSESLNALQSYYGNAGHANIVSKQLSSSLGSQMLGGNAAVMTSYDHQSSIQQYNHQASAAVAYPPGGGAQQQQKTEALMMTTLNQKVMKAQLERCHISSQSQAGVRKENIKPAKRHMESYQHGQNSKPSQLQTLRNEDQSRSHVNTTAVEANLKCSIGGNLKASFKGGRGGKQKQYFHQSPIELRSDSTNMFMQLDLFARQQVSEFRQPEGTIQGDDDDLLFERESQEEAVHEEVDDETVLLETAGFLPLKKICSQLQQQQQQQKQVQQPPIETANSSERPHHQLVSSVGGGLHTASQPSVFMPQMSTTSPPLPLSPYRGGGATKFSPPNELFYPQQQGVIPQEHLEKGVQTTTSFLDVSICKTPVEGRSRNFTAHNQIFQQYSHPISSTSPPPSSSHAVATPKPSEVQRMSLTCRLEPFKNKVSKDKFLKSDDGSSLKSQMINKQEKVTTRYAATYRDRGREGGALSQMAAFPHKTSAGGGVRTPKQLTTGRCILTSMAPKTNLEALPSKKMMIATPVDSLKSTKHKQQSNLWQKASQPSSALSQHSFATKIAANKEQWQKQQHQQQLTSTVGSSNQARHRNTYQMISKSSPVAASTIASNPESNKTNQRTEAMQGQEGRTAGHNSQQQAQNCLLF